MTEPADKLDDDDPEKTSAVETTASRNAPSLSQLEIGMAAAFAAPFSDLKTREPDPNRDIGMEIGGKYRLAELVGEGGMGTVWLAQQSEPVKRTVAIKLIKAGMDSRSMIARFNAERQALAMMDHPNIAKVLDGGLTDQGRPYFVMELVNGTPITIFCDERRLNLYERLKLFVPVCQAIQHAHQKGIIHRDIKPSNVLITTFDDKAVPKVIDFGVAKATGTELTDQSVHTSFGMAVGTPEYMSPEQASLGGLDVDTRSDVFSLGVLLYELLAGSPPFRRSELEQAGMLEILRFIRDVEPPLPSKKLSTAKTRASIAAVRNVEPDTLTRILRSDMDWVVMKAIEKKRDRRYPTAAAFSADIERFLTNEPVLARPASRAYKLKKFAWRNRRLVLTSSAILAAIVAGSAFSFGYGIQARRAEQRAVESEFTMREREAEARENLALAIEAVDRFCDRVADDPRLTQNDLRPLQQELLRNALEFQQRFLDRRANSSEASLDLAMAEVRMGRITAQIGSLSEAAGFFEQGADRLRGYLEKHPDDEAAKAELAEALARYGMMLSAAGDGQNADRNLRAAVAVADGIPASTLPETDLLALSLRRQLAGFLIGNRMEIDFRTRLDEAERLLNEAVTRGQQLVEKDADDRPVLSELTQCELQLSRVFLHGLNIKRYREAEPHNLRALELAGRLVNGDDVSGQSRGLLAQAYDQHGHWLRMAGKRDEAIEMLTRSTQVQNELVNLHRSVIQYRVRLGAHLNELASLLESAKQGTKFLETSQEAVRVFDWIEMADPGNVESSGGRSQAWFQLSRAQNGVEGNRELALVSVSKAIEIGKSALKSGNESLRGSLSGAFEIRSEWMIESGDLPRALADLDEAILLGRTNILILPKLQMQRARIQAKMGDWRAAEATVNSFADRVAADQKVGNAAPHLLAAETLVICATKVSTDPALDDTQRGITSEDLLARAVRQLTYAIRFSRPGDPSPDTRPEFESLRDRVDFKKLNDVR